MIPTVCPKGIIILIFSTFHTVMTRDVHMYILGITAETEKQDYNYIKAAIQK